MERRESDPFGLAVDWSAISLEAFPFRLPQRGRNGPNSVLPGGGAREAFDGPREDPTGAPGVGIAGKPCLRWGTSASVPMRQVAGKADKNRLAAELHIRHGLSRGRSNVEQRDERRHARPA
jgi:hypothetical protein